MISEIANFFNMYHDVITFITHTLIFVGTLYVAIHNRNLPQWHLTPLWYVGLFCFFVNFTLTIEWTLGPEHELSHTSIGSLADALVDVAISSIAFIMFIGTVKQDIEGSKKRRRKTIRR